MRFSWPALTKATIDHLDAMAGHDKRVKISKQKLAGIDQKKHAKRYRHCRWTLGREIVAVSQAVRSIKYTKLRRQRLIDRVTSTVDAMRALDHRIGHLEK